MLCVIDGDCLVYKVVYTFDTIEECKENLKTFLQDVLFKTQADGYVAYLTGTSNFRRKLFKSYKANRAQEKPILLEPLMKYAHDELDFKIVEGAEADDAISLTASNLSSTDILLEVGYIPEYIICGIDHDLLQIPGKHYNLTTEEFRTISVQEAQYNFWLSMIVGKSSNNTKGVSKWGTVKGKKLLDNNRDYPQAVWGIYQSVYGDQGAKEFRDNYLQLKLLTENEFKIPVHGIQQNI